MTTTIPDRDPWDIAYEMAHREFNRLQVEQRNAIIEKCAQVVDMVEKRSARRMATILHDVAIAIRALKDKP